MQCSDWQRSWDIHHQFAVQTKADEKRETGCCRPSARHRCHSAHSSSSFFAPRPPPGLFSPMPSLFSRARTTSTTTPIKPSKHHSDVSDEFGRVPSRASARGTATVPAKKDKIQEKTRIRTLSSPKTRPPGAVVHEEDPIIPDGSFFPLNLDPPASEPASMSDSERGASHISSSFFHRRPRDISTLARHSPTPWTLTLPTYLY